MACNPCKSAILESGKWWGHYPTEHHGKSEQASFCVFCRELLQHSSDGAVVKSSDVWTVSRRASSRDTQESLVITFRPVAEPHKTQETSPTEGNTKSTKRPVRTFYVVATEEPVALTNEPGHFTGSEPALRQLRAWIDACDGSHDLCKRMIHTTKQDDEAQADDQEVEYRDPAPKRLIDVGLSDTDPVYVVDLSKAPFNGKVPRYCTLSYCWGDPSTVLRMTPDKVDEFMDKAKGLPNLTKNKTYQHAVQITRMLGLRYLWVDALCIIQGDGGDFVTEGPKMHEIYRKTFCTLAAAASRDGGGGLFYPSTGHARDVKDIIPASVSISEFSKLPHSGPWTIFPADMWEDQLLHASPLYSRGWVVQERMLSPRIIHFAASQLFWDCLSLSACESFPSGLPALLDHKAAADREWRERLQFRIGDAVPETAAHSTDTLWHSAIRHYTSCNLTKQDDIFTAIWGIAKVVCDISGERYNHGLWSNKMAEQLAWKVTNPRVARRSKTSSQISSWSWASIQGAVELGSRLPDEWHYLATDHRGNPIASQLAPLDSETQPKVMETALAIRSSIVEIQLVHIAPDYWTAAFRGKAIADGRLKVYLDSEIDVNIHARSAPRQEHDVDYAAPKDRNCFHALLLAGKKAHSQSVLGPHHPAAAIKPDEEAMRWSGYGLLLEAGGDSRFRREGIFRFSGLNLGEWKIISTTACTDLGVFSKEQRNGEYANIFLE